MWNPSLALVDASGPTRRLKSYREIGLALDRMTKSSKTSRVVFAKFWKLFLKPILRGSGHPQLTGIHGNCQDFFEQVFPLVSRTVGTASGARHPPILLQHIDRQGWQGRASSCWNLGVWKQTMIVYQVKGYLEANLKHPKFFGTCLKRCAGTSRSDRELDSGFSHWCEAWIASLNNSLTFSWSNL